MKRFNNIYIRRIVLLFLFTALFIISLFIGVSKEVTLKALLMGNKDAWLIFKASRWPRTIAIVLAASSLSVAGLIMQSISRNKFISPATSGTTDAAMLGVLISYIVLGNSSSGIKFIFAFIFAFISSMVFMQFINKLKYKDVAYIPLIGIMYGGILSAITTSIALSADKLDVLNQISHGQFISINDQNYKMLYIVLIPLIISFIYATKFSIISAGKDFSINLGINYNKVIFLGLAVISVISATTFIIVGPLPFIGLIIPNIVSKFYGDNIKKSIFDIALFGSIFVLINDIISRLIIYPKEISITLTMGVIGSIIFLILIFRGRK